MDKKIKQNFKIKYLIFLFVAYFALSFAHAQNCKNFESKCSSPGEKDFSRSAMSRTIKIRQKQRYTFNITLFENKEYYISVCGKSKLGNVQLKILSGADNKLMYDNAANGFVDYVNIKSELSQKLIVEISAPTGKFSGNDAECLGILIESRKFNK
ncbi:MAG: hypothetical protein HY958_03070 [Bacteroidia bacterium]|nr:hypothetical protein [Bacteroidia bacterium]